jgi:hypothetical protein
MGLEVPARRSRRAAHAGLIAGTGSGPDGSSLTAHYQRSWGGGTEKGWRNPETDAGDQLGGLAMSTRVNDF